jgi:hypothetical protein
VLTLIGFPICSILSPSASAARFASNRPTCPVSSEAAAELLVAQYRDAVDKGATVLVAGGRIDRPE